MAITAALIAGGASLASAGIGAAASASANQRGNQDSRSLQLAQLQDARNNEAYVNAINALMLQQSRAGFVDSEGNAIRYDPATNQYISTLGPQPAAARRASLEAMIQRNTQDQADARRANMAAEARSLRAASASEPFLHQIENYQPVSGSQLGSLLQERGAIATNDAYRPIIQEALMQAARQKTAGGQIIADVGRQSAADLRKNAIDSMIAGETNAANINRTNLGTLADTYTAMNANATPQLQFPGIATDDTNKTMATLAAQRAQLGVDAGRFAGANATGATTAAGNAAGAVSTPDTNETARALAGLSNQIVPGVKSGLDLYKQIKDLFPTSTIEQPPVQPGIGATPPVDRHDSAY